MADAQSISDQILSVFPDVDPTHVDEKLAQAAMASSDRAAQFEWVVQELLNSNYPKKMAELDLTELDPVQAAKNLEDKTRCITELQALFADVDILWLDRMYDQNFAKHKSSSAAAGSCPLSSDVLTLEPCFYEI